MGWLLRPVIRGLCKYESLIDCTLGLSDVALLNEALDCTEENESRATEAARAAAKAAARSGRS